LPSSSRSRPCAEELINPMCVRSAQHCGFACGLRGGEGRLVSGCYIGARRLFRVLQNSVIQFWVHNLVIEVAAPALSHQSASDKSRVFLWRKMVLPAERLTVSISHQNCIIDHAIPLKKARMSFVPVALSILRSAKSHPTALWADNLARRLWLSSLERGCFRLVDSSAVGRASLEASQRAMSVDAKRCPST
jgi:hypothetical protein